MKIEQAQIAHIKLVRDSILQVLKRLVNSEMWESSFLSYFSQSIFITECEQIQFLNSHEN